MVLFILAYLGGALTLLSPCILPVLPFVFARADRSFVKGGLPMLASARGCRNPPMPGSRGAILGRTLCGDRPALGTVCRTDPRSDPDRGALQGASIRTSLLLLAYASCDVALPCPIGRRQGLRRDEAQPRN